MVTHPLKPAHGLARARQRSVALRRKKNIFTASNARFRTAKHALTPNKIRPKPHFPRSEGENSTLTHFNFF